MRPASEADAGIDYLRNLEAGGDTNIAGALQRGLGLLTGDRPGTVIFLTDGLPTAGIEDPDGILQVAEMAAPERTQLFAFGVGYDVDTVLLDALSSQFVGTLSLRHPGRAHRHRGPATRGAGHHARAHRHRRRASTAWTPATWRPRGMTGIFAGNQALLTGRYVGSGPATVVVTGNSAQGAERFTYQVEFPERDTSDPTVAQLWAQRRVADLLTELRIEGSRDSLVAEIVDIATRFGIVTPYTAYLAQEPDLAFTPALAARCVDDAVKAAPTSGEAAVPGAADLEALRDGQLRAGWQGSRVVGAHTYYLVDGTWVTRRLRAGHGRT